MARLRPLTRFSRLPIRARLTVAFVGVMAAVLAAAGVFLYGQFSGDLDAQIGAALRVEADDVEALVDSGGAEAVSTSGARLAQLYAADGRLLESTHKASGLRLLTVAEAGRAASRVQDIDRRALPDEVARVRAVPVPSRRFVIAVADSLELHDHELARLRTLLLIAGPLALLLAGVAAYELARAALRPVDRMRARSELITERQLSERLPVSEPDDEIGALGRTLNAMLDRVERAVARERRLVSDASHELRTPLTTLRAEVDLALLGDRDPAELRAALESAAEEAERMSRLADDLLVLARADQGRLPLNPEPIGARDLLEAAAGRARAAADVRERSIVVHDEVPGGGTVQADPDRTAQALDNLVTNSLRYGDGAIVLSARSHGDLVELHVTDEGRGFPDELVGHAFERFGRGDEVRGSEPGTGLGLALVEAVATAHGGHAEARNRPEGGADVWIALPRA